VLDNITLYWLAGTGASAARLYWESIAQVTEWFTAATSDTITVPAGCSIFPAEVPRPSRRWARRRFDTSCTGTNPARAATSPPGSSRACSSTKCAPWPAHAGPERPEPATRAARRPAGHHDRDRLSPVFARQVVAIMGNRSGRDAARLS
jgi:hypothetical protein